MYIVKNTKKKRNKFKITLRLLHARRHAGEEIDGRHIHLVFAVWMWHLNGSKIAKHFVGRGKVTNPIFVLNDLRGRSPIGLKKKNTQITNRVSCMLTIITLFF